MTLENRKENFSEWYLEVVRKAHFMDQRTPVKGFDVYTPWGYGVWELIMKEADALFKKNGVKNVYFPLLIPKSLLEREAEHFEGFVPEVAWVTRGGERELGEWLAIRPTSETIMYYVMRYWVSSYRDLPLKVNQWVNIVRWETKMTKPFLRGREFLWQEGHTLHTSFEDAAEEVNRAVEMYSRIFREVAALPFLILRRTERDKFAGAEYTIAFDTFVPEAGRALQIGTVHHLGEKFARAFDIKYKDEKGEYRYVNQTSWGFSTRLIGAIIAVHGDDKGAVLPPRVSPVQVVIIPIPFKGREDVIERAREIGRILEEMGIRVHVDDRDGYTPGWKFNEWELKGVPLRVEVGPRDVDRGGVTVVRRDTGEKRFITDLEEIREMLESIQKELYERARRKMEENIVTVESKEEVIRELENGKMVRTFWCGSEECEINIKEESGGEIRGTRYDTEERVEDEQCFYCGRPAKYTVYIARSW